VSDTETTPPREAVRPAVACIAWESMTGNGSVAVADGQPWASYQWHATAIDGTAADIRERVRAALARTDLVPIHHVKGITDIVTRALGVQP